MRGADAVGAVDHELVGGKMLNEGRDFGCPAARYVFVAEDRPSELISGLIGEDCRILGVREVRVLISVG